MTEPLKKINITITYKEDGEKGLGHTVKHKIESYLPIGVIVSHVRELDRKVTPQQELEFRSPLPPEKEPEV